MIDRLRRRAGGPRLLIASVMLATFMQALDTTIANVALPEMQGALSATPDQVAWVLTSYIVAAAIVMPITGWLSGRFGRRRVLVVSVTGFTLASVLCGLAQGIGEIVVYRLLQGLFGASLVPIAQSLLLDTFPREKQGAAMAVWGMGLMVGPILGPPLGGLLTEYYDWRWVFFINLPIGVLALVGILASVPPEQARDRPMDFTGLALLALGIGSLQLMLDRGHGEDWFDSLEVQIEAAVAFLALYAYGLWWWSRRERALLDIGLLANPNFAAGCALIGINGLVLYATISLLPSYLNHLMGYPVLLVGLVMGPRGIGTLLAMAMVSRLVGRMDIRWAIAVGLVLQACALEGMIRLGVHASLVEVVALGMLQGFGLGFVFVPIATNAYATLPAGQRTEAAGLFSLLRNLGASIGISIVFTLLARGTRVNEAEIVARIPAFGPEATLLSPLLDPSQAATAALLEAEVRRQAAAIAYANDFQLLLWLTLLSIPLLLLMRPLDPAGRGVKAAASAA